MINRATLGCAGILMITAYVMEKEAAADCQSTLWANNVEENPCNCPADGSCHNGSDSLSVTAYYQHASECRVHIEATWSCSNTASADLEARPDPVFQPPDSTPLFLCGADNKQICRGDNWSANGMHNRSWCNNEEGYFVQIVLNQSCGDCDGGLNILTALVNCEEEL